MIGLKNIFFFKKKKERKKSSQIVTQASFLIFWIGVRNPGECNNSGEVLGSEGHMRVLLYLVKNWTFA